MLQNRYRLVLFLLATLFPSVMTHAQSTTEASEAVPTGSSANVSQRSTERTLVLNLLGDQKAFWTTPARIQTDDVNWLVPFVGATSLLIGSDSSIEKKLPTSATLIKRSQDFSNLGLASLVGTAGTLYFWGRITNDDHRRETGFLSGEALANSFLSTSFIEVAAGRDRPLEGNGQGQFWRGGSSFPSDHSAAAWSVASVIAHEYPGPLTKLLAYGTASAISASRVTGRKHFASDVFIGSSLGWYLGRQVYRGHHNPELDGAESYTLETAEKESRPESMGSPYVPLDSWIYPAFDRLAALGYAPTAFLGMRPWTRMECARLIQEAADRMESDGTERGEAHTLYATLAGEFAEETARWNGAPNLGASLDSIYTRVTGISGTPLRDGYHFGQTIINDYGRPYGEGFNDVTGVTAHAEAGPLAFSIQGEYQHAPAVASDPLTVLQATAAVDQTPILPNSVAQVNRFQLLDSTVSVKIGNTQVSFGKQSLWLGPTAAGPLLFSDNAEPLTMLRIDTVSPYRLPLLSDFLGPVRTEFFIGQLSGQQWIQQSGHLYGPDPNPQPFIHGTKVSFKPTANLEIGLGFTAQFAGLGVPFTWQNFLRTFYSHRATTAANPGKRLSEFNFSYRIPGLREWAAFYADSLVIDEYSPLVSSRPAINPGIYLSHFPKVPKMDLRVEGVTTNRNVPDHFGPGAFYWDGRYVSGYTNDGNLMGNWVGRRGGGEQAWATYWFSPRNTLQLGYRNSKVDRHFLDGGRLQDFSMRTEFMLGQNLALSGLVQREDWRFPLLAPTAKSNITASLQMTFWPTWKVKQK
jgi:membrane-associated phospholipid phosphatase